MNSDISGGRLEKMEDFDFQNPVQTDFQTKCLSVLADNGIYGLYYHLSLVVTELENEYRASTGKWLKDFQTEQRILKMLLSLHEETIKALIRGDFGRKYRTDTEFRKRFHETDTTEGIYINTILRKNGACFLSVNEMNRLIQVFTRYMSRSYNNEAVELDERYLPGQSIWEIEDTEDGFRRWIDKKDYARDGGGPVVQRKNSEHIAMFISVLERQRIRPTVKFLSRNPGEEYANGLDIMQHQSPLEIGWSKSVETRLSHHRPPFPSTTKLLGLLACGMEQIGIDFDIVQATLLPIAEKEDAQLGEIFLTILSSSVVQRGGLNLDQGGGTPCSMIMRPRTQWQKLVGRIPELTTNLEKAESTVTAQGKILDAVEKIKEDHGKINDTSEQFEEMMNLLESTQTDCMSKMEKAVAEEKQGQEKLESAVKRKNATSEFYEALKKMKI